VRISPKIVGRMSDLTPQSTPKRPLKARFPKPEDVEPTWLERAARLKEQYLATKPGFDSEVAAY
jgi:hypothetical protein